MTLEELQKQIFIFDFEVTKYDWLFVAKHKLTKEYTIIHNDNGLLADFMVQDPILAGFNNKHYDQFILKAILLNYEPSEVKQINDMIIAGGMSGWDIPDMQIASRFRQYDLMDDCQAGISLKAFEAHYGMDITESTVDFNIDHSWSKQELDEMIYYCKHDVDATDVLDDLRKDYLKNKITLGEKKGLEPWRALYMTNAKLTSVYLDAKSPSTPWMDERDYTPPACIKWEYIPEEVSTFFAKLRDKSLTNDEVFSSSLEIEVGGCPCTIAYGGFHGAIPTYMEESK